MKTRNAALSYAPAQGRYIYIASWFPGGGIAGADAACEAEKPAGAGPVRAVLPVFGPQPLDAATRGLSAGGDFIRPDGIVIGSAFEIANGILHSGPWQYGDGTYLAGDYVLTGSENIWQVPTSMDETCQDWTSLTGTTHIGFPNTIGSNWWNGNVRACDQQRHIYCAETDP